MKLLNSTKIGDKQYTLQDSRGFVKPEKLGLDDQFYGGRVTNVAKTDKENTYMLLEGMTPIDILIVEEAEEKPSQKKIKV